MINNKIAIVTMTSVANYGNALQNYAVKKLIEKSGYFAETLKNSTKNGNLISSNNSSIFNKLKPSYIHEWYKSRLSNLYNIKNDEDSSLINIYKTRKKQNEINDAIELKKRRFSIFQKEYLNYTDFTINNTNYHIDKLQDYFAFIAGSDQIWNPNYRTNSEIEFLQFAPKEKRIALAPSFGISKLPDEVKERYKRWINEIPYLSVRENEGAKIIKELTGRDAIVLLDPTFGLDKEEWNSFSIKPNNFKYNPNEYVFCYFLGNRTKKYTKYINEYAKKNNCKVVDICDINQLENYSYSPQEFIWLLANSKAVFTDSFHGCALSINLNKPFVVFDRVGDGCISQSSRISTILSKFNIDGCRFSDANKDISVINYNLINELLLSEKEKILDYLRSSLNEAISQKATPKLAFKNHCTGCEACYNVCLSKAISMIADEEGFLHPLIDEDKCVNCKKCENICPIDKDYKTNPLNIAYYAYSKNDDTCKTSSSGGIFSELATKILEKNGIVYGASFNEYFEVCHAEISNIDELEKLKTSKYVQSRIGDIYLKVKFSLDNGKEVLFSGTPCQISGLKKYLDKEYSNLYLVDIACHGVPSPMVWKKYLKEEHNKKISKISFRNKDVGWNDFSMKVEYEDGSFYRKLATEDSYVRSFLANLSLRPSCYQCQYKTIDRESDITIADYWGVEVVHPELSNQQGVSLVIVHSDKGKDLFSNIENNIIYGETNLEKAARMNSAITNSVKCPMKRVTFFSVQGSMALFEIANHCLRLSKKQIVRKIIYKYGHLFKNRLRRIGIIK